jgi:tetratricopeptide (TPR) repeat protein
MAITVGAHGQQKDTLTFAGVESSSYRLYLDRDWKQLSRFCDRAIRAHYDYYYLRMRAGIACYETGNYRKAIRHFIKALDFNDGDETALRYLYESYQYAGQYEESRNVSRQLDTASLRMTGADRLKDLSFVSLEGAMKFSDSSAKFRPATYVQLAGQHYIQKRFSLFHALTYYGQDEYRQSIRQYQYYLSSNIPLKHNLLLSPALHVLHNTLKVLEIQTTTKVTMPSQQPPQSGQPQPQPTVTVNTTTAYVPKQTSAMAGALTLTQRRTYGDVSLGITACVFDTASQYQVQAGLTCYPFGNRKLALGALLYHHTETNYRQSNLAIAPCVSSLIRPKLLLSASWLRNRGGNVAESNAYLINNSIDVSLSRFTMMAEYSLLPHFQAYAVYSYDTRQEKFTRFHYHYHLALLGIKFIP